MKQSITILLMVYLNLILAYIILASLDKDFISIPQLFSSKENVLSILLFPFFLTLIGYMIFIVARLIIRGTLKLVRK